MNQHAVVAAVERDADLCLRPRIDEFGILEFESIDRIVDAGYRYASAKRDEIRTDAALGSLLGGG